MPKQSAGLVIYRRRNERTEYFLVHPGGPFWQNKDAGSWSIPKGEFGPEEIPLDVAQRELLEETGLRVDGPFLPLGPIKQKGGKIVHAWAVAADFDADQIQSNTFSIEWPPRSGKLREFPEVDRAAWFDFDTALEKMVEAQRDLLKQLEKLLSNN
ncbi:MAG TPA: NUDIX domain-containing protein [Lacipirellulaceae bacterium]|jgi:predicted NUDIX family NTP pyrophosphohydrolase|nr:NUDIX domain-containing protein [Lacipirellulaceae bacterium]